MPQPPRLTAPLTALLVIDVQEKLLPLIPGADALVRNIHFLLDAARVLGVTVLATEQYPKGLGKTVPALAALLPPPLEKIAFSSCGAAGLLEQLQSRSGTTVLLVGMETHVCVQQTVLDLLSQGFPVFIAVDAVASRYREDYTYALRRMEQAGAVLTTVETVVFEWAGRAGTPEFKSISKLVQERMTALPAGSQ